MPENKKEVKFEIILNK